MSKYFYNKDYFESINNEDQAYWLGFLYADGCITRYYKNEQLRSMSLELQLCREDKCHLEKFVKSLNSNVPIKDKRNKIKDKVYESNRVVINCTKLCYDLINLGCTPKKTLSLEFPTEKIVPQRLMRDFMRGFFDGDGCICITEMNNKPHISVNITGIESMLQSIGSFLIENKIITKPPHIHHREGSNATGIFFYGNDAKRFLDYIYKGSVIYLDRKYEKYVDFYKDYSLLDCHGVHWSSRNKAYIVTIYKNGRKHRVGQSKSLEEAIEMRKEAEMKKYGNLPA